MKKYLVPFLYSTYPVLFLYSSNLGDVDLDVVISVLLPTLLFTLIIFQLLNFFVNNSTKSSLLLTIFLILFFTFGRILPSLPLGYRGLIIVEGVLFLVTVVYLLRTPKSLNGLLGFFAFAGAVLFIFPTVKIVMYNLTTEDVQVRSNFTDLRGKGGVQPDIYYIILDGHARSDVLKRVFDYDNSKFIKGLEDLGFFVAKESTANYPQTALSLSSTMSQGYLDEVAAEVGFESTDRGPLNKLIESGLTEKSLRESGYLVVNFTSPAPGNNLENPDVVYEIGLGFDEFENVLLSTTPIIVPSTRERLIRIYQQKLLYMFDHLSDVAEVEGPTFTYAHFVLPHPPFVFDKDGNVVNTVHWSSWKDANHFPGTKEEYRQGYREQVQFTDKKILKTLQSILSRAEDPTIIVLQADHGSGYGVDWANFEETDMQERFAILNAYYFYDKDYENLYSSITPVNTFRVIFNQFFGAGYEILEDRNFFASWLQPYEFIDVTARIKEE